MRIAPKIEPKVEVTLVASTQTAEAEQETSATADDSTAEDEGNRRGITPASHTRRPCSLCHDARAAGARLFSPLTK